MSNTKPDPKDYPFNYVVHEGEMGVPFDSYGEAVAFCQANYPECLVDESWFGGRFSSSRFDGWIPEGPSDYISHGKYVWKSVEERQRMIALVAQDNWEEEVLKLEPDAADELCALGKQLCVATIAVIERKRDAYEEACRDYECTNYREEESEFDEDEGDCDEDECANCGSYDISDHDPDTIECYKCGAIWPK